MEWWSKGVMVKSICRESPRRCRQDRTPAADDRRFSSLLTVGHLEDHRTRPLRKGCSANSLPSVLLVKTPISEAEED